ncbi:MAG: PilT/PilU family type 4a pilus ATPase [Candidatus Riflebacteria bacterium]|nr:PilT/PilU family type 4a pilus ATPase [Candidatus Riflebacteria bacterium]
MIKIERTPELTENIRSALAKNNFFSKLVEKQREQVIEKGGTFEVYEPSESIVKMGDPSDFLFVIILGDVSIIAGAGEDAIELTKLGPGQMVGEIGILLEEVRSASSVAITQTTIMRIHKDVFKKILAAIPEAGLGMMKILAERLKNTSRPMVGRAFRKGAPIPPVEVLRLLPTAFMQRHRVAPVRVQESKFLLGYCDLLDQAMLNAVAHMLPSMTIEPVAIDPQYFNTIMQEYGGDAPKTQEGEGSGVKNVNDLLNRLVEEGGSDLHLSAGQVPRWRIDGDIKRISGYQPLGSEEAFHLLQSIMRPASIEKFNRENDEDFAYSMDKNSRFRVNILRDQLGISAVLRHIPNTIFSLSELGLPDILRKFCDYPKGLILVTGPTGSGKSTTLAAMIDYINQNQKCHILTLEDPIEFVHESKTSLVNQREVGIHTKSFARALKAALREDPDVVLIGEMRDHETVSMALETANTGHLVLATLHTSTAMSTIDRIVDLFPAESQNQTRSVLAESLIGVCCQTLCRKIGGGRVPALEILVSDFAVGNLIRENKTHQLINTMVTAQSKGNRLLNDDLMKLVSSKKISSEEALSNSSDKRDMEKKLGLKTS